MKESIKEKEKEQKAVSGVSKGGSGEVCGVGDWGGHCVTVNNMPIHPCTHRKRGQRDRKSAGAVRSQ